jgi:hypothetical protein
MFDKFTAVTSEFTELIHSFLYTKAISQNFANFSYLKMYFWGVGMLCGCADAFPTTFE